MTITDKIAEGRRLLDEAQHRPWLAVQNSKGENWPIAHFGCGHDGNDYDLTSDGVHASDHRGDARTDSALVAHAVNSLAALLDIAEAAQMLVEAGHANLIGQDVNALDHGNLVGFPRTAEGRERAKKFCAVLTKANAALLRFAEGQP